ncbi:MAG: lysozyme [Betaproteobacteria bacterium]
MNLDIAAELCRRFEGFKSAPYLCPAGVATIGYGSTFYSDGRKVTLQDAPMSEPEARALLMTELLHKYAPGTIRQCPILLTLALKENDWRKLNAIVDFAYNLGVGRLQTSTLRRKINEQDWAGAKEQLMLWTRGGGRVLPGLLKRRTAERSLL